MGALEEILSPDIKRGLALGVLALLASKALAPSKKQETKYFIGIGALIWVGDALMNRSSGGSLGVESSTWLFPTGKPFGWGI